MKLRPGVVLLPFLMALQASAAQTMPVPIEVQAPLLLKVLRYDKAFEERAGDEAVLGVVYQSGFRDSKLAWESLEKSLGVVGKKSLGRPFRIVPLVLEEIESLEAALRAEEVDWVYIAPLRAIKIEGLLSATQAAGVATLTGVPEYVDEGVAFGATQRGNRPAILVNLTAARSQRLDFGADLLKLAVIVGEQG